MKTQFKLFKPEKYADAEADINQYAEDNGLLIKSVSVTLSSNGALLAAAVFEENTALCESPNKAPEVLISNPPEAPIIINESHIKIRHNDCTGEFDASYIHDEQNIQTSTWQPNKILVDILLQVQEIEINKKVMLKRNDGLLYAVHNNELVRYL